MSINGFSQGSSLDVSNKCEKDDMAIERSLARVKQEGIPSEPDPQPLLPPQIQLPIDCSPKIQIVGYQKLVEQYKEDALNEGVNKSDLECFIKQRLQKDIERRERVRKEREAKLLEMGQERAGESSEAPKKSDSKVDFDSHYTIQKFNRVTRERVGSLQVQLIDSVKTREDYRRDYISDYVENVAASRKRKRECEQTPLPCGGDVKSEFVSAIEANLASNSSDAVFGSSNESLLGKKTSEKEEEVKEQTEPLVNFYTLGRHKKEIKLELEFAEKIMVKLKDQIRLTEEEASAFNQIRRSREISFAYKKPEDGMSSFMKRSQIADRAWRGKICREFFQQYNNI